MSRINTLSQFFYGTTVTILNRAIDFDEGGGFLTATLRVGSYSVTEYAAEVQRAMREAGTQAYVVTFNRSTGLMTISAPFNFEINIATGPRAGTGAYTMMGFTGLVDLIGANSYTGNALCGDRYVTQYVVNDYVRDEHNIVKENGTVNSTPAGLVQQVTYGDGSRIQMNIRVITDKTDLKLDPFFNNPTGIADFMRFIAFALSKGTLEFMPDKDLPNTFFKVYLESTREDRSALRFTLKNMKTPDFYESGTLVFRKVLQ